AGKRSAPGAACATWCRRPGTGRCCWAGRRSASTSWNSGPTWATALRRKSSARPSRSTRAPGSTGGGRGTATARWRRTCGGGGRGGLARLSEMLADVCGQGAFPHGPWPEESETEGVETDEQFTTPRNILSGKFLKKVYVALIPTAVCWQVAAHLRVGGWNECP